jgi:8-oxo-dGTP diphosphatase
MRKQVNMVDLIIRYKGGIILIRRKNPPLGWALPGGMVEPEESLEDAAVREAREETGLDIRLDRQMHTYSDPARDERFHAITTVFIAEGKGKLKAGDIMIVPVERAPKLCFDHNKILIDYENGDYS